MRICVLADKPSILDVVLPHLREMHPDMDSGAFAYAQVHPIYHLNPYFDLPRGLPWRDYPFSGGPLYRPFRFGHPGRGGKWQSTLRFGSDEEVVVGEEAIRILAWKSVLSIPRGVDRLFHFRSAWCSMAPCRN